MTGPASTAELPIHAVLPALIDALSRTSNAVLIAPPGAGKTTIVGPALLDQPWCSGQILLLSPRRLAARMAAEHMAQQLGEPVGQRIGYATRMDARQSRETRLLVVTEGIFRNRIIADPELAGVSAVLFDEVHERSLDSDFGLALALEAQAALRADLRLLAMSATLDGARFAALMGDAPLITSEGRSHPLALHHIGRDSQRPVEDEMARAIRRALSEQAAGDVLAFLPSVREITRTIKRLSGIDAAIFPLHGQLEPSEQRAAVRPAANGARKVILATSIAETSVTIDGVRIVVDSGLARRARYDVGSGTTALVTERASLAAATQRAGRAARQGPGTAYRLWEEAASGGMPRFDPPEIANADLAPLLLDCALWGERKPARLPWIDPPPVAALVDARARLMALDAVGDDGGVTAHGRAMASLPLPPALAHMLIAGAARGQASLAAEVAMLLTERGLGGNDADIAVRHARWMRDQGSRARAAQALARRWAKQAVEGGTTVPEPMALDRTDAIAWLLATAHPDRVARRRDGAGERWQSAGGRGYRLDPASPLAGAQWLAVADVQGAAGAARIMSAASMSDALAAQWLADHAVTHCSARYDRAQDQVEAVRERRLGQIILSSGPDADGADPADLLLTAVQSEGLGLLHWGEESTVLRARACFAGLDALEDAGLSAALEQWLPPLLKGKRGLAAISDHQLVGALFNLLSWEERQRLDRLAPAHYITPAGSSHAIDYGHVGGPCITARVQAFFGLDQHPMIGSPPVALLLSLTSPAGRPIQTTADLPGFWRGSWTDVVRDMRGRYPKHPWPDAPWAEPATLRTKRADAARKS